MVKFGQWRYNRYTLKYAKTVKIQSSTERNRLNIPGVGYVVKFDDVKIRRITDGTLKRIGG